MTKVENMDSNHFYGKGLYILAYENMFCEDEREKVYIDSEQDFKELLLSYRLTNNFVEIFPKVFAAYHGIGYPS